MSNEAAIRLKITKANALFDEVNVLMNNKFYATAINRLYYSCFHATTALLLTKSLTPKTHKGVSKLLHEHFVNDGFFDGEKATFFGLLMKERIQDDYNDFLILDENEAKEFIAPAKEYIEYVSKLIDDYFAAQRTKSTRVRRNDDEQRTNDGKQNK
jgi:uncharacterized protein (UPF0332 family)